MEKLNVLLNGMRDVSFMSNKDMMITHSGHFTPSIRHRLLTGEIINEMLKIERKGRIEMKAKMGYLSTFPTGGIKNKKIMGGVGIMELNDIQVQRRINWHMIEHRNGRKLGQIGTELLRHVEKEIGMRIDKVTSKGINTECVSKT